MYRLTRAPRTFHVLALLMMSVIAVHGQTTTFTYQGQLTDAGALANGSYDMRFALFDGAAGGTPIGTAQAVSSVPVSDGVFTAPLDFGADVFPGANRFVEIGIRPVGGDTFTTLAPRQQISSSPYAIRSLRASAADTATTATSATTATTATNATQLGGVAATSYVQSSDSRLTNARHPTAGSVNYIQNTLSPQQDATFNIDGNGTVGGTLAANVLAANYVEANSFDSLGLPILRFELGGNLFVGGLAGGSNDTGTRNSFLGGNAGTRNSTGDRNTIVGSRAETGPTNLTNATAIGADAQVDQSNSLVLGSIAGVNGATASTNVGVGTTAPKTRLHVVGSSWFQGDTTPLPPSAGKGIVVGFGGEQGYISAFDYGPFVPKNLLLNNSGGNVGIGTTTPLAPLHVNGSALVTIPGGPREISLGTPNGEAGIGIKGTSNRADVRFDGTTLKLVAAAGTGPPPSTNGVVITTAGNVGIGQISPLAKLDVAGTVKVDLLAGGGSEPLCRNSVFNTIATCSSSLRYKTEVGPFTAGLDLINRLRPVSFTWKEGGARDLGFVAEDVNEVEPLLVTQNDTGDIEGVKYDRLNVVLVNAIKEQQSEIEALQAANATLDARLKAIEQGAEKQRALLAKRSAS